MREHPAVEYVRNLQNRIQEVSRSTKQVRDTADGLNCLTEMLGVIGDCILLGVEVQLISSREVSNE